ncbi:2-hydroxyhepta-2,4-diene-1,7-dioate isomerase [Mycobacterium florentinum]|uniref:2-hydroxyhepta-2,4-diene-1,7-dioate isomerase n=1 Tax=Mycobacterium florentinum TaxID=292462 RepID=A0A1X1TVV6_MYCFL|nr:fumarylacetoacetate hydrolase family protein [Mycobacterium florentinum]MCV7408508.1 fumarylacetoacetate hydrolase family protein [Mycobacterium florentinum]ORV48529.1 2-hydroxyhepta-2,4-diene-1,7-dioate isomerase [Mycobacterium florentinum]BBX77991.1 bifunctional 2-hydroxyhepta-2,4-diene-1,7-dioate isomerase/cyclase/dehydrase [Mycobacterium florentinum]
MRWATYRAAEGPLVGVVFDDAIHALPPGATLIDLISAGTEALHEAGVRVQHSPHSVVALADVQLMAPIPRPPVVRDCLCFLEHMRNCQVALGRSRELSDVWYRAPAFYFACPSTVIGPYDDVAIAPGSAWPDFELEVGAVIAGGGADLTVEQAEQQIVGYTIFNDWTARDHQMLDTQLSIGQAKGKDSALTLGPFLVTPDELAPYCRDGILDLRATASVNGNVVGTGSTASMDWSFAEVISYASRGVPLYPGEVFGSGTVPTCTLVEHLRVNELASFRGWLHDGDVVTLEVEGLGHIRQTVRASASPVPLTARPRPGAIEPPPRLNRAAARFPFTRGLHAIADRVWAWVLPDGGFGWSNAGLVAGDGQSLLVDTLFDAQLTREMLDALAPITDTAPIRDALITHSNGDHTHGAMLLDPSVRIVAAEATADEIAHDMAPEMMAFFQKADLGPVLTTYARDRFGGFDFGGITARQPEVTFAKEYSLDVGGRRVDIYNLGPAHTGADAVAHVPDVGVLFAGDLMFFGCTPIAWAGPIDNWVAACDAMLTLDPEIVVPGHGPVGDADGIRGVRDYLRFVMEYADSAHRAGHTFLEAADRIDLGEFATWLDAERIVANIYRRYCEIDTETPQLSIVELFTRMAEWLAARTKRQ